jgi:hypothetical protein
MSIGINELRLNQATICEFIQESLNRRLIVSEHVTVVSVIQPGSADVTVIRTELKKRD